MKFHILGLFPEALASYFEHSLLGKAKDKGLIEVHFHQLRDWATNKYHAVDDRPYGGGVGMVFLPDVLTTAIRDLKSRHGIQHVILPTPAGHLFTAARARHLSGLQSILFVCGRYEGVDQRVIDLCVDEELSIGDYVITGGELASAVMIDAISRFVPETLGCSDSSSSESHENGLLEYPHYTRPEIFEDRKVPDILLSGHHDNISKWRHKQSLERTWQRRPDLLKHANLSPSDLDHLKEFIHSNTISRKSKP